MIKKIFFYITIACFSITSLAVDTKIIMVKKIVSDGQTGVDRAALLDVAIKLKIPHGGWRPRGRLSESGKLYLKNIY